MSTWDVIVIGGGAAGENAAQYAIQDSEPDRGDRRARAASAASARTGRACRARRCCGPSSCSTRRGRCPAWRRCCRVARRRGGARARATRFTHNHDDCEPGDVGHGRRHRRRPRAAARLAGEQHGRGHGARRLTSARCTRATPSSSPPARTAAVPPVDGLREAHAVDLARRHQPARGARARRWSSAAASSPASRRPG